MVSSFAAVRFVNAVNPNPAAPYTSWSTAAVTIQDAVDVSLAGDEVLVTNGVYASGGRAVFGFMTNRVALDRAIFLHSVNGPQFTTIQGYQVPGATNGDGAIRCVYLTNGARLFGFTLTNGATRINGDLYHERSGGGVWCEFPDTVLSNCVMKGNAAADLGGGAYAGQLLNCLISTNSAGNGGGASYSALTNCQIVGNVAGDGGGAHLCLMEGCLVMGNAAFLGGGIFDGSLGPIFVNNCTLVGNSASYGGGVFAVTNLYVNNCIIYFNTAATGSNYYNFELNHSFLNYCCTAPQPGSGYAQAVITSDPLFVNLAGRDLRLQSNSPCINAGNNSYVTTTADLDGNARIVAGLVDMGAYEFQGQPPPRHYVDLNNPGPERPYTSWATAATNIQDAVDAAFAGDDVIVTNGVYATGEVLSTGAATNRVVVNKPIALRSVNGAQFTIIEGAPGGTAKTIRCIYLGSGAILSGFTLTNGSAGNAGGGGAFCEDGAVIADCVVVSNSVNMPFGGGGGVAFGALTNCLLMGNHGLFVSGGGGATYQATLNRCTLVGNWVTPSANGAVQGGGAYGGALDNCLLTGNVADPPSFSANGGGAALATLRNCSLVSNQGGNGGGGTYQCSSTNCIIYFNTSNLGSDNYGGGNFSYCCTTPDPGGVGNITSDPLFVDFAGGNFRPKSNSPCINAGNNFYVATSTDLDGNPRIINGTVDMGAYEYQGASGLVGLHAWLGQNGLPSDGSADYADSDGDGMNNYEEWRAGTNPTNAASVLRMISASPGPRGVSISWQSVLGVGYYVERSTNLNVQVIFSAIATNIAGQSGSTTHMDTNAPFGSQLYYRVGVQ